MKMQLFLALKCTIRLSYLYQATKMADRQDNKGYATWRGGMQHPQLHLKRMHQNALLSRLVRAGVEEEPVDLE